MAKSESLPDQKMCTCGESHGPRCNAYDGKAMEFPNERDVLRSVWKTLAGIGPDNDRARIEAACAQIAEVL